MSPVKSRSIILSLLIVAAAFLPVFALDLPSAVVKKTMVNGEGTRALCSYYDSNIGLFDLESGALLGLLKGHSKRASVGALAFSPDGKTAASGSAYDTVIILWNLETMKKAASIKTKDEIKELAFSPDGNYLAARCDGKSGVLLYKLEKTPKLVAYYAPYNAEEDAYWKGEGDFRLGAIFYNGMAFSPDSTLLVAVKHSRIGYVRVFYATGPLKAEHKLNYGYTANASDSFFNIGRRSDSAAKKEVYTVQKYSLSEGSPIGDAVSVEFDIDAVQDLGASPSGDILWFKIKKDSKSLELYKADTLESIASVALPEHSGDYRFTKDESALFYQDSVTRSLVKWDLAAKAQAAAIKLSSKK